MITTAGSCPLLALARHASSTWTGTRYAGRSNPPLSDAGRREAAALAGRVARSGILAPADALIIASPLARALDTARAVAGVVGRPIRVVDDWTEVDFGEIEGLTFDEASAAWPDGMARLAGGVVDLDWPGGEAHHHVVGRVSRALRELVALPGPILVVSHGMAIRSAFEALGVGVNRATRPAMEPGGLVVLRPRRGRWRPGS